MNRLKTMGLFGIAAIAVFMVGLNGVNASMLGIADTPKSNPAEKTGMLGHITLTVKDPQGNIKAYQQTDNLVTNMGTDCSTNLLFGATKPSSCTGTPAAFKYIALSTNAIGTAAVIDTTLTGEITTASCTLDRAAGTPTATASTSTGTTAPNTVATISNTFTNNASCGGTVTVASAGLFDAGSSGDMFAERAFGSSVSLNTGDQLTVNWQITLS